MMRELSPRPNIWYGTFGPAVWALTGQGRGGAGIVPWAYGLKGSGKTVLTQGVCAHLSPAFSPSGRIMAAFDSTTAAISRVMEGLEGSFLFVDDGRKRTTSRAADTQAESIEALVRTGYAGGSARRAVSVYNQVSRTWAPGVPELSAPVIGVSAEILPTQEAASTLERIYPIPFDGVNIFASGDSRKFEDMADGGLPAQHWAHLAQWMLGRINDHGMDVWKKHVGDTLAICVQKLDALPVSKRVKNVAARVSCGMLIWAEFLRDTTVITGVEFSDLSDLVHATIADNAAWHGSVNVEPNDGPAFGTILNSLRAAVASGQAYNCLAADITGVAPSMKARLLGALVTSRDGSRSQFLAMQPRDVLQILATEPRFRSLTESELGAAFKEVSLTDTPGKLWKTVTVAGIRTRTLAIPYSLFVGAADTEAETP